jgi:hypothetical protein
MKESPRPLFVVSPKTENPSRLLKPARCPPAKSSVVLRHHRKILVIRIRRMTVGRPQNADGKDQGQHQNDKDRAGSYIHTLPPRAYCAPPGDRGSRFLISRTIGGNWVRARPQGNECLAGHGQHRAHAAHRVRPFQSYVSICFRAAPLRRRRSPRVTDPRAGSRPRNSAAGSF